MNVHSLLQAAVLGVALCGPATAAFYTGIWDPPFGVPFAEDLGWRGSALFSVPDSCELGVTGSVSNVPTCGGAAKVTSATVELYDINGPVFDLLATIVLDPNTMTVLTLHYVNGDLDQLETAGSAPVAPVAEFGVNLGNYDVLASTTFSLQFAIDGPHLYFVDCAVDPIACTGGNDGARFPPQFSITRVPEPASLALAGLAVAVLGAVRRRRARLAG